MSKKDFEFQPSELLEYSLNGNKEKTGNVTMSAPSMSEYSESEAFGQTLMRAIADAEGRASDEAKEKAKKANEEKGDNDEPMKASDLRAIVLASNQSPQNVASKFKALAVKVSTLDDAGTKMKESHFNKMELDDFIDMMYGYAAHFIIPSLLSAGERMGDKD